MTVTYTTLPSIPELMDEYKSAAKDLVPALGVKRSASEDPATGFEVTGVRISISHLAAYCASTGLRLDSELPVTYPYVLSFPLAMKVMTTPDFPFNAVGSVHLTNVIEQKRALTVDDVLTVRTHAENLRPHRKGLLIDMVTEIYVEDADGSTGNGPVWTQTSAFLAKGAKLSGSASAEVKARPEDSGSLFDRPGVPDDPTPSAVWTATPSLTRIYADASGDRNPIHVSALGAKAFGFPARIAHGMWSAARMVSGLEGEIHPDGLRFAVEFAKPVVLPCKLAFFSEKDATGTWKLQVRSYSKLETLHAVGEIGSL
ncbi:MaoC family dehydratase [Corynebacterium neomassiliense]|uniref:MaoC family dehydratase n=1 Tax=Corynebacterium neomassiliense TaxID=2079482 RepID=UPI001F2FF43F|nr:MaoC family dehydratase [Corynebacterium neomassiliense]